MEKLGSKKPKRQVVVKMWIVLSFLSSYIRDREVGKLHYLRVSGKMFCRKKETKGMLYD